MHILQCMASHIIVQSEPSMNFISFEAVETSVHIDILSAILYVPDLYNILTIHQEG